MLNFLIIVAVIVFIINASAKKKERERKTAEAKRAYEARLAAERERAAKKQFSYEGVDAPSYEHDRWGTPIGSLPPREAYRSSEGGYENGEPFCEGEAGRAMPDGYDTFSGEGLGSEGAYGEEGAQDYSTSLGTLRTSSAPVLPTVAPFKGSAARLAAKKAVLDLDLSARTMANAVLYAEILAKPKALRRANFTR